MGNSGIRLALIQRQDLIELRDGDKSRYLGKGVLRAVENLNTEISVLQALNEYNDPRIVRLLQEDGGSGKLWYSMPIARSSVSQLTNKLGADALPLAFVYHIVLEVSRALLFLHNGPAATRRSGEAGARAPTPFFSRLNPLALSCSCPAVPL